MKQPLVATGFPHDTGADVPFAGMTDTRDSKCDCPGVNGVGRMRSVSSWGIPWCASEDIAPTGVLSGFSAIRAHSSAHQTPRGLEDSTYSPVATHISAPSSSRCCQVPALKLRYRHPPKHPMSGHSPMLEFSARSPTASKPAPARAHLSVFSGPCLRPLSDRLSHAQPARPIGCQQDFPSASRSWFGCLTARVGLSGRVNNPFCSSRGG